jgi:hypothetical protein
MILPVKEGSKLDLQVNTYKSYDIRLNYKISSKFCLGSRETSWTFGSIHRNHTRLEKTIKLVHDLAGEIGRQAGAFR